MLDYGNLSRNSAVAKYRLAEASIDVQFKGGGTYRYERAVIGVERLAKMKGLAEAGKGLATFITQDRAVHAAGYRV
ncbi:hypothetical protein [Paracoccus aminophilus]|uniref:Uncharacterized protein n=1 Tax=Paracoccus aminophilus JCM 7686 TaxID=1367847 RepID=S5XNB4_PARAH|nr:hypothetical protein [Paracoccus aminophilus]AGT08809.1 hypothetical protein JCM7686_1708 [Paracoccus aminophilus JCM 7686]